MPTSGQLSPARHVSGLQVLYHRRQVRVLLDSRHPQSLAKRAQPNHPQISSRLSMTGTRTSEEGKGARPSLRVLAPCPDVAPRCSDVILLLTAAMPAPTIARPTQHSGSKSAFRFWHPGVD